VYDLLVLATTTTRLLLLLPVLLRAKQDLARPLLRIVDRARKDMVELTEWNGMEEVSR
jgi:hypothetical protein